MEQLIKDALEKYEETIVEIEKTKERRFSMAHRTWPEIGPMEERRDGLKASIINLVVALELQVKGLAIPGRLLHSNPTTDPLPGGETNYLAND